MQAIAEAHGESKFRVAGVGEVTSRRPYARLTATEAVRSGIRARADGMIWGMSQIPLVTLLITSLAVVNTVVSSVRARRWDLGILRALGTTRGGLIRLILAESLLIGLVVCTLGLAFGVMAGWCGTGMARYLSPFGGHAHAPDPALAAARPGPRDDPGALHPGGALAGVHHRADRAAPPPPVRPRRGVIRRIRDVPHSVSSNRETPSMSTTRRTFLGRGLGLGAAGLIALDARPGSARAPSRPTPPSSTAKGVDFLRPRQGDDGSWSGTRKEPGITALVVTALLRSKRVTPDEPAIVKGLGFLEQYLDPKGGLAKAPHSVYSTSVALMAFQEANRVGPVRRRDQGEPGVPQGIAVRRGGGEGPGRPAVRRPGLRRRQQPARPVEHLVHDGGPARHRPARRRPGPAEGPDLRLAVPEPQERVQRPALGRQGQRRRLHLHVRRRRAAGPRRPGPRGRGREGPREPRRTPAPWTAASARPPA